MIRLGVNLPGPFFASFPAWGRGAGTPDSDIATALIAQGLSHPNRRRFALALSRRVLTIDPEVILLGADATNPHRVGRWVVNAAIQQSGSYRRSSSGVLAAVRVAMAESGVAPERRPTLSAFERKLAAVLLVLVLLAWLALWVVL